VRAAEAPLLVIPGDDPPQIAGSPHLERLRPHGEVVLHTTRPANDEEKLARTREATVILNTRGSVTWSRELLERLPRLKMIATCSIGVDAIDIKAARDLGIVVSNVPGRTAKIVAEHAIALLLAAARQLAFQTAQIRAGRWGRELSTVLVGKTLGVIGTGAIGCEVIRLGRAIGMEAIAWTFHPSAEKAAALGCRYVELDDLLRASDAVSVHLKLTPESRKLVGARELALMKRGGILVNTSRGPVVDTEALVAALRSGHLAGAGLDVYDLEPLPPDHPLLACDRAVLTPHSADQNPEGIDLLNGGCVDNVIAYLEGRPQKRVV